MEEKSIGFIGGGRIVRIFLEGFRRAKVHFQKIMVSDTKPDILHKLKGLFPYVEIYPDDNRTPASAELVFLALHPPVLLDGLKDIKESLRANSVLISLAPKITLARISAALGGFNRILRMIPNAPSIVNAGYNPVAFGAGISQQEKDGLLSLFSALGKCPEVKEETLEAYAILAAMGPTYFWFQWEELARMGGSFGIEPDEARKAISQMIEGAAKTLFYSNLTAAEVMDLIPVRPLAEEEDKIREVYRSRLGAWYEKPKSR